MIKLKCEQCSKVYQAKPYTKKKSKHHFCGFKCYGEWQKIHRKGVGNKQITVLCYTCNKSIKRSPSNLHPHSFCSPECLIAWRSSEERSRSNSSCWRGGHPGDKGENWKTQKQLVLKRDHHTCQYCGTKTKQLHIHHIKPYRLFETYLEANILENLITLCPKCHTKADSKFWKENPDLWVEGKFPKRFILKICAKCGFEFKAKSPATLFCEKCCTFVCKYCSGKFISRRGKRTPVYCSKECRNKNIKTRHGTCKDCGNKCHLNAKRCHNCDIKWYRNNPNAPRRGRKAASTRRICPDCGGKCHSDAIRCMNCFTKWSKNNPGRPRRKKVKSSPSLSIR